MPNSGRSKKNKNIQHLTMGSLEQFIQTEQNTFLTCSWRFLRSNKLEQLGYTLEKTIGIEKHAGKVRKRKFSQSR